MERPTFEQACICPKCSKPGEAILYKKLPNQGKVYTVFCRTEVCRWFDTSWAVQVDEDNLVYERPKSDVRAFPKLSPDALAQGQRMVEDAVQRDLRGD